MASEVAVGRLGALCPNRLDSRRVGNEQRLRRAIGPRINERKNRCDPLGSGKRQEHPTALFATLQHAGIAEDLEVARHARLALPENLRELADRKLHQSKKK